MYESEWVHLCLTDVEIPGAQRFEHHVIRSPRQAAGTVVHHEGKGVLLLWRHRFITDTWGWEIPAGRVDAGETAEQAAVREVIEETGWQPVGVRHLITYRPMSGISDQRFNLFIATGAIQLGDPSDTTESERVEWVQVDQLMQIVEQGGMVDGLSLTAVLWALAIAGLR